MRRGQSLKLEEGFLRGVRGHASQAVCDGEIIEVHKNASWVRKVQCSTQPLKGSLGFLWDDIQSPVRLHRVCPGPSHE